MPGLREKLSKFLDRSASRRFEWGVADCLLEVADWLDVSCGWDLANEYRGRYSTEEGANALTGGDLLAFMRSIAASKGIAETAEPVFGDVALVSLPGQEKPLGAVLLPSGRWRMRTATGIAMTRDVTVIQAWANPARPSSPKA